MNFLNKISGIKIDHCVYLLDQSGPKFGLQTQKCIFIGQDSIPNEVVELDLRN